MADDRRYVNSVMIMKKNILVIVDCLASSFDICSCAMFLFDLCNGRGATREAQQPNAACAKEKEEKLGGDWGGHPETTQVGSSKWCVLKKEVCLNAASARENDDGWLWGWQPRDHS
jgi:hypothetical protein